MSYRITDKHTVRRIPAEALTEFSICVLQRAGLSEAHARDSAQALIWASLRGVDTHGIRNLKRYYVDGLNEGTINADAQFRVISETDIAARADGDGGIGLAGACWAMRTAITKAKSAGVGMVSMRNSQHLGAAGYYAHMTLTHDMIGLCMSSYLFAAGQDTVVRPSSGGQGMLATNPVAVAVPTATGVPFLLDMATAVTAINRIELMQELGRAIPPGWGVDENGQETTDPDSVQQLLPLGGTPEMGGHKGFGMAVAVQALCGVLSGAWCRDPDPQRMLGKERRAVHEFGQEGLSHFCAALRIDQFGPPEQFKDALSVMIRILNESSPAGGEQEVMVAGQPEHEIEIERYRDGIPVHEPTLADLQSLADQYDVPLDGPPR